MTVRICALRIIQFEYAHCELSDSCLVAKKRSRKKRRQQQGFSELEQSVDLVEQCQDDETNTYVKAVVNALSLGDDEILLAIAWATAEGRLYHIKYPQVLGIDVKYGTNSERRPLARGVGKTGNERNFTPVNSYMPSEQRYAYSWVTGEGIQGCLDADALLKTTLIPTDEDKDQIAAIDGVLKTPNSTLGYARLRLCKWHKVRLFKQHSNIRMFANMTLTICMLSRLSYAASCRSIATLKWEPKVTRRLILIVRSLRK